MGAILSKVTPKFSGLKYITNQKSLSRAISFYICQEAKKQNTYLPSDIITLCVKMLSFIMVGSNLSEKEKSDLFDHLKSKTMTNNMMHCKLLYEHNFIHKFDMKIFIKTIENKSNILVLFLT
eukprot:234097_1